MYRVFVFTQEGAHKMEELGYKPYMTLSDITGKQVFQYIFKDDKSFEKSKMPQGAVIKYGLYMNF